jgi:PAS domain S-box-containing protein
MSDHRLSPVGFEEELKQSEDQLELLHAITKELAATGDLASALQTLLRRVCEKTGWVLGQAWVPNETGTILECGPSWPPDGGELQSFRAASKKSHFAPGIGLPGRVWLSRQFSWIDDVTADPNFPRASAARAAGVLTGAGIPLVSGGKVIAVLEFFMRETREESEQLLSVIASLAGQLDLLHRGTEAEAAKRQREFRTLANSISQLAWMADEEGSIFWYNDRWYEYTGTSLEEMRGAGWEKVLHPDVVGRVVERIKLAVATGEPWEDTFPLRNEAGEYRWFLSRALPIFDAEGRVARWFGTSTDITEQRELEKALREHRDELERTVTDRSAELSRTNQILRSILSNMGDAVIVADKEENLLVFNPAAERMFGKGAPQVSSSGWATRFGLYLPDKTTPYPDNRMPLMRSIHGEEVNNEEMFVRHDQAPNGIWTRVTGRPLRDSKGDLLGGVIVCRDITQVKEEEFFRAGQSRVLEMIAADRPLPDVLTELVLLMEAQAEGLRCSILLLDRDGKHVRHGAAPHLPEAYVKAVDGAAIGPRNGSCGTAMFTRRPVIVTDVMTDPLWADYRELARISGLSACWSTPVLSSRGDVLGSFAMYREEKRKPEPAEMRLRQIATHLAGIAIERQQQQEILRERDARIQFAAESADLAFWVIYPDGSAWMSEKGRRMYGFDSELPLTCDRILSRVHIDERAAVKNSYDRDCTLHGNFESEHRLVLPYGQIRWVIMRGRCLKDGAGNLLEVIGVTLDVSAQKQAELEQQLQREEMAHRNRVSLMGEMTASFAHELNQPLTAIANNAAAARRFFERGNPDPELFKQLLLDMAADSHRAGEVIRGIRSLVRKEATVAHTLVDLNAVITDTVTLVRTDILSRQSTVLTELDADLPQVKAALVQIQQVLLNLIMNALDAVEALPPANRRIVISTRADKGRAAELTVRDFGSGLPKDRPDKVFDHFFSTKEKGMGLGLAIVRSIVEAHGGVITAENAADGGARMTIRLPGVFGEALRREAAA